MKRMKAMALAALLLGCAPLVLNAEEEQDPTSVYLGPETVRDIPPEEALADPSIIKINTAGSGVEPESRMDYCLRQFRLWIQRI